MFFDSGPRPVVSARTVAVTAPVRQVLSSLTELAIVEATEHDTIFRVSTAARSSGVEALMAVYEEDRSVVLSALTELAIDRIRDMAIEAFGEALARGKRGHSGGELAPNDSPGGERDHRSYSTGIMTSPEASLGKK